jgi:hypothetical protein
VAVVLGVSGLVTAANAANPGSATIGPPNGTTKTWEGMDYAAAVNPDRATCPSKRRDPQNLICDHFTLNVNVSSSFYNSNTGGAQVRIDWPDEMDDFDLYAYKNGVLVASSAQGGTTSEIVTIDRASGTYEIQVLPFLVTASGYTGAAKFVSKPGVARPPLGGPAVYYGTRIASQPATEPQNKALTGTGVRPPTFKFYNVGRKSAEPTIGVDKRLHKDPTTGKSVRGIAYYASATFDGPGGLADTRVRRSLSEGRTWNDATPNVDLPITLDPYVYVEEDSQRLFNLDLYVANSFLSFSDDGGKTYQTNPAAAGNDIINDHQTLFAGPPPAQLPAGVLPPSDPKFPEFLYYCFNRVADSSCARSTDGGRTFVKSGESPYLGVEPKENNQFCGGLHGHVYVDKRGIVYLPKGHCNKPYVSISKNAGLTWNRVKVNDKIQMPDNQTSISSDQAGNLYYVWYDPKYKLPYLATSSNQGTTWSTPLMIAPPNVREVARFGPTVAAGANGKIAISFPATTQANEGDLTRPWDYYVVTSQNAMAAKPIFASNIANPATDPVHRGECPGRCGNMLDFLDIVISPAPGHAIWATVVDTCTAVNNCSTNSAAKGFDGDSDNAAADMQGMVARQVGGTPDLGPPGGCSRTCGG